MDQRLQLSSSFDKKGTLKFQLGRIVTRSGIYIDRKHGRNEEEVVEFFLTK
jgi:hypothetical protein